MIYLTILNTLAIVYLIVSKQTKLYLEFRKETTPYNTLLGFSLILQQKTSEYSNRSIYWLYLPIRNKKKTEMIEDANVMKKYTQQHKVQSLTAKFSWLKTLNEVKEFQEYYTCVDEKIVKKLVDNFVSKNN